MSKKNFINYSIIELNDTSLSEVCQDLRAALLSKGQVATRIVLFFTCGSNEEYAAQFSQLQEEAMRVWGDERPIVSCVAQPVLSSVAALEVHSYNLAECGSIIYKNYEAGGRSIRIEGTYGRLLFVGEMQQEVVNCSIERQAEALFKRAQAIFDQEEMPYNSIVRQWNYVEKITGFEGENQHYQLLNNARSTFYNQTEWVDGYPAATGIGADFGGINVDIDALLDGGKQRCRITPIDNKLQVAAHAYSECVLFDANKDKATPKFERAKSLDVDGFNRLTYISGTAAIRGEESVANLDVVEQCENTLENMAQLVDEGETMELLRVYLKYAEHYEAVERYLSQNYSDMDIVYLQCDVCRDELLIEIEGISMLK